MNDGAARLQALTDPIDVKDLENQWDERCADFVNLESKGPMMAVIKELNYTVKRYQALGDALALAVTPEELTRRKACEKLVVDLRAVGRHIISYRTAAKIVTSRRSDQVPSWYHEAKALGVKVHKNIKRALDSIAHS